MIDPNLLCPHCMRERHPIGHGAFTGCEQATLWVYGGTEGEAHAKNSTLNWDYAENNKEETQ